jgi:hypothetical protein
VGKATTSSQEGFDNDGMIWVFEMPAAQTEMLPLERASSVIPHCSEILSGLTLTDVHFTLTKKAKSLVLRFDDVLTFSGDVNLAPSCA